MNFFKIRTLSLREVTRVLKTLKKLILYSAGMLNEYATCNNFEIHKTFLLTMICGSLILQLTSANCYTLALKFAPFVPFLLYWQYERGIFILLFVEYWNT